ncbi:hypothetical protein CULT_550003 [[Clostridium] ultunense Esp]|uniref:Hpt domain-containing protein n=1 Tax=Thermicanus aegyptius TaxID=94009 RepID=UPI0002B6FF67|nr:Hpt domain-containing protein [Thermicanus aegyptius]CCQ97024.1 hypothetical protein CULT_550003 [[Clostridium] ultunense Esp]
MRLSEESERRLTRSLVETLSETLRQLNEAFREGEKERIRKLGHALKGNSGAHYFGLTKVKEIGIALDKNPDLTENEWRRMVEELEGVIQVLQTRSPGRD